MYERDVTVRRNLQQAGHVLQEAVGVLDRGESLQVAREAVGHAYSLLEVSRDRMLAMGFDYELESGAPAKGDGVTLRLWLEQVEHSVVEALSVVEHGEDLRCALDDVACAMSVLREIVVELQSKISGRRVG